LSWTRICWKEEPSAASISSTTIARSTQAEFIPVTAAAAAVRSVGLPVLLWQLQNARSALQLILTKLLLLLLCG
jgi:hypothetical protein